MRQKVNLVQHSPVLLLLVCANLRALNNEKCVRWFLSICARVSLSLTSRVIEREKERTRENEREREKTRQIDYRAGVVDVALSGCPLTGYETH